ncbi:MAG: ankyrin repeat domain-containing protein, partial [Synergistaceae bacterium]|nr:ankyrin repeat domain-containing protein [Synergistaceae bacterium]
MTQEELNEQLIKAANNGDTATVRKMLEQGADPNSRNNYGKTALMYACRNGEPEMIQMLLDAKVDPNVQ